MSTTKFIAGAIAATLFTFGGQAIAQQADKEPAAEEADDAEEAEDGADEDEGKDGPLVPIDEVGEDEEPQEPEEPEDEDEYEEPGQPPPGHGPPPGYPAPPPGYGYGYGYGYYPPAPPRVIEDDGQPVPDGYHRDTRIRKGLVIGGASTLGALWLVSSVMAGIAMENTSSYSDPQSEDFAPLFIPVIGPFISIGTLDAEGAGTALLMLDGFGQVAGLAMLIAGVAAKEKVFIRDTAESKITIAPTAGSQGGGLSMQGTF